MNPSFEVPAQYFYALAPNLPQDVSADVRYRMACLADEKQIVDQLRKAIDAGIISADSDVTPEMAAHRLHTRLGTGAKTDLCIRSRPCPGAGIRKLQDHTPQGRHEQGHRAVLGQRDGQSGARGGTPRDCALCRDSGTRLAAAHRRR